MVDFIDMVLESNRDLVLRRLTEALAWISTSLGFGVSQMTAGLNYEYGVPDTITVKIGVIVLVMGAATLSSLSVAWWLTHQEPRTAAAA